MRLSSKGRYAVMAMADLAKNSQGSVVTIAAVAERQELSSAYLEQLFSKLRRAGLVTSVRGPGGGYRLALKPHDTTISNIMQAVEEPVKMTRCHLEDSDGCVGDARCLTHDLWRALGDHIAGFLENVTLGDVIDNASAREYVRAGAAMSDSPSEKEAPRKAVAGG
jgi:Rrf2 family transcriptional regulator, iron-sulfur cluster assembly transcription factor